MEKDTFVQFTRLASGNSGQLVYLNQKLNTFDENKFEEIKRGYELFKCGYPLGN